MHQRRRPGLLGPAGDLGPEHLQEGEVGLEVEDQVLRAWASQVRGILEELNSPEFAVRQAAQQKLNELSADQVDRLASYVASVPSAEAAVRCTRSLAHHFLGDSPDTVQAAWEGLEALRVSDRQITQEEAAWVLTTQWRTRLQLAVSELTDHGALILLPETAAAGANVHRARQQGNPAGRAGRFPAGLFVQGRFHQPVTQVFLTDEWSGDPEELKLLHRLPGLQVTPSDAAGGNAGFARQPAARRIPNGPATVIVFLIDGHPLIEDDESWLKATFGNRVQERGQVMLGIKANGAVAGQGCPVTDVVPFGSADASGLLAGDLIQKVADREVLSFDDLVQELHRYSPGETVEVTLKRIGSVSGRLTPATPSPLRPPLQLPVHLRSWKDYVRAIQQAAATNDTPEPPAVQ